MENEFAGIEEKLKRASQNIVNLEIEIRAFFQSGKYYPILPSPNDESWQEAVDYHRKREIPQRFSVLAGEIVHHLRSCLDHIVWQFSSDTYRRESPNAIEFPVLEFRPRDKNAIARYEGKIKGISNTKVRELICNLQPYFAGSDAANHPLCIIHNMDRFDKHRELAIFASTAFVKLNAPPSLREEFINTAMLCDQGKLPDAVFRSLRGQLMKDYGQASPQISFRTFGGRKIESVVEGLQQLHNFVAGVVAQFRVEMRWKCGD